MGRFYPHGPFVSPRARIEALPERDRLAMALALIDEAYGTDARRQALAERYGLGPSQSALLACLDACAGRVVSHEHLRAALWDFGAEPDSSNRVAVHVSQIRKRTGLPIENVWAQGYRLPARVVLAAEVAA